MQVYASNEFVIFSPPHVRRNVSIFIKSYPLSTSRFVKNTADVVWKRLENFGSASLIVHPRITLSAHIRPGQATPASICMSNCLPVHTARLNKKGELADKVAAWKAVRKGWPTVCARPLMTRRVDVDVLFTGQTRSVGDFARIQGPAP